MGELTNLNPRGAITDADIPASIARDSETAAAIANHEAKPDPHPIYLTQAEGDGRYRQSTVPLVNADIPEVIARDKEVADAISAHNTADWVHLDFLWRIFLPRDRTNQNPTYVTQEETATAIANHLNAPGTHSVRCTLFSTVVAAVGSETIVSFSPIPFAKIVSVSCQMVENLGPSGFRFVLRGGGGDFAPGPRLLNGAVRLPPVSASQLVGIPLHILIWHIA